MERSSKNLMELFKEKYPMEDISKNRFRMTEALGYLKCLSEFAPYLNAEIDSCKLDIYLMLTFTAL